MDKIFDAKELAAYEAWLDSAQGMQYQSMTTRLLDTILDCRKGWRVLDVGCGLGLHLKHLRQRGLLAHGLDMSPVAVHMAAKKLGPNCEIDLGDAHDLPYEDNSFDAVIMMNTLELVDRPAQVLAEAARVSASRLCIITMNFLSFGPITWRYLSPYNPLQQRRSFSLLSLWRLVREVLGPVPQAWSGATTWPSLQVGHWPFAGMIGVCAAVTPRYMTRPLIVEPARNPATRPAHSHGSVAVLRRVK
ncbi:class I SAM-dependent methyltransferase [Dethiosulfatarculus sandiegensis]|uniref:Type 11 methyltransferase n=1 Tax=Dethiosulfatarculus sandiegensis TaxID=1429043 RepID=A0A0D2HUQ7_9BACT|nr:class I SAM-dependent methyltransferase [Dethiosulfatarculus sandiegensis]KIX14163.1 type 11 methyltransferase [Dethiosulfatarculus sandiegensis]